MANSRLHRRRRSLRWRWEGTSGGWELSPLHHHLIASLLAAVAAPEDRLHRRTERRRRQPRGCSLRRGEQSLKRRRGGRENRAHLLPQRRWPSPPFPATPRDPVSSVSLSLSHTHRQREAPLRPHHPLLFSLEATSLYMKLDLELLPPPISVLGGGVLGGGPGAKPTPRGRERERGKMLSIAGERRLPAPTMETMRQETGDTEKCPRCGSRNTKFCYYNNYNLSQPRHFCKACRRYWTLGGSLRNVPIGGSTRGSCSSATTHHPKKQPHRSSASVSSFKRRRASTSPSPSTSLSPPPTTSPAFDVPSLAPFSVAPNLETTCSIVQPASVDIVGSFVSMLTEPLPGGFLALGDHLFHGRDDDFDLGLGFGGGPKWVPDEVIGFDTARPAKAWPFFADEYSTGLVGTGTLSDAGINGEQHPWPAAARGAELVDGNSGGWFGWSEMPVATTNGKGTL